MHKPMIIDRPPTSRFMMSERELGESYGPGYRGHGDDTQQAQWLSDTALLQHDHPRIRLTALRLTQLKAGHREKAIACYRFVRKLPLACTADAAAMPSVEVLAANSGDNFTKCTLLVALLRSLGVPARARVVLLKPDYLGGIFDIRGGPIEHVFCEVLLESEWLGVDSYVNDLGVTLGARNRLLSERRNSGWGVHLKGQVGWDGKTSSFGHFASEDPPSLPLRDMGAFHDVGEYYRATHEHPRRSWVRIQECAIAAALANHRIRKLRKSALQDANPLDSTP